MEQIVHEQSAQKQLERGFEQAKKILDDEDKTERFLQRLEKKLRIIPVAGGKLAEIPVMASLVRSYVKKEYTDVPLGSIIAMISALLYFISPVDIIPDSIPVLGYSDDAAVIAVCWKLVESDVEDYVKWRQTHNKVLDL